MVQQGNHPGKSSIHFLPMIDMNPSCDFSTMMFVCSQANKHRFTPVITFDQPLWWKAMNIIQEQPANSDMRSVVLRLGGLHLQMSFLGAIGNIMVGSGLHELLEMVYADNAVSHILSGKAIARATCAHLLVDAALHAILVSKTFDVPLPSNDQSTDVEQHTEPDDDTLQPRGGGEDSRHPITDEDLKEAGKLYDDILCDSSMAEQLLMSEAIKQISARITDTKESLSNKRTASLWLQYLQMIGILQKFIKAERTGNWQLHLQAVCEMLPFLAAAGHNLYAKSAYLYLQHMAELEHVHPEVHSKFLVGHHVIRRSDRYWAGLSSDLIIEQVLMRSIKTTGGLTRGRGMTETQRLVWVLSVPVCVEMNHSMQEFTNVQYATSDQHKDMSQSRQERDVKDTNTMLLFLASRDPFGDDPSLHSIATGATAGNKVNVDVAKKIGDKVLESLAGKAVQDVSFKKKEQAVTMKVNTGIQVNDEVININPELLFQRLIAVREKIDNTPDLFKYELCSHPAALFDTSVLPREATKAELANGMWEKVGNNQTGPSDGMQYAYVVDGGSLLQQVTSCHGQNYEDILSTYTERVTTKYGKPIVVFDGYESGPSTKHATHQRRAGGGVRVGVNFTTDMVISSKKDVFLSNTSNKQHFITFLGDKLMSVGCTVHHAKADADVLIVQKAVESAQTSATIVVGEDTDLLVLLCYHADKDAHNIFFKPKPKTNAKRKMKRIWNIKQTKERLGDHVCRNILFVHAVLGCDTTSRIFGIGKSTALKKLCSNPHFSRQAEVFNLPLTETSVDDVVTAGERALVCLYNGKDECLDDLRYRRFCQKVSTSTTPVKAKTLPPTSATSKYHSLRVYLQIQDWKGNTQLDPLKWGWKLVDGKLVALLTDLPPAPKELLEIIRCKCKTGCKTGRCTCKKHGLECTSACGECKGMTCENSQQPDLDDDNDDDTND